MLTIIKILTTTLLAIQLLNSCSNINSSKVPDNKTIAFKDSLIARRIDSSDFYISLPANYTITPRDGIDFVVYYFFPADTTIKAEFSGGLYFGNFPSKFEKDNDSCKTSTIKSRILDSTTDWTIYNCDNGYALQTIIDSKSGEDWDQKIHAFGNAISEIRMHNLLDIFSTLKQIKK